MGRGWKRRKMLRRQHSKPGERRVQLGAKIIFVGLDDIHPPTASDVAATYAGSRECGGGRRLPPTISTPRAVAIRTERAGRRPRRSRPRTVADANCVVVESPRPLPARRCSPTRLPAMRRRRLCIASGCMCRISPPPRGTPANTFCWSPTRRTCSSSTQDKIRADLEYGLP